MRTFAAGYIAVASLVTLAARGRWGARPRTLSFELAICD